MPINGKQMVKFYKQNGWSHARTSGSHWIMKKDGKGIAIIPQHGSKTLGKGLEAMLIKGV